MQNNFNNKSLKRKEKTRKEDENYFREKERSERKAYRCEDRVVLSREMRGGSRVGNRGGSSESEVGGAVALHESGVKSTKLQSLGNGGL